MPVLASRLPTTMNGIMSSLQMLSPLPQMLQTPVHISRQQRTARTALEAAFVPRVLPHVDHEAAPERRLAGGQVQSVSTARKAARRESHGREVLNARFSAESCAFPARVNELVSDHSSTAGQQKRFRRARDTGLARDGERTPRSMAMSMSCPAARRIVNRRGYIQNQAVQRRRARTFHSRGAPSPLAFLPF